MRFCDGLQGESAFACAFGVEFLQRGAGGEDVPVVGDQEVGEVLES